MKINPRAGHPAAVVDLVDVSRLITADHEGQPDPRVADQGVLFEMSGHRGFSFKRALNVWHIPAISQSIFLDRKQNRLDGPLFREFDTRTLSQPAVGSAMEVLVANCTDVMSASRERYTPTPVICHAIVTYNRGRTGDVPEGIVITLSHNPPDTGGFKYNPPQGGPAEEKVTAWPEAAQLQETE